MATQTESPLVWANEPERGPESRPLGRGICAAFTRSSPARPETNEDALAVVSLGRDVTLLAVADGCGGMPAGDRASRTVIEAITDRVLHGPDTDLVAGVLDGFDRANAALSNLRLGAGSTLTAALIRGDEARIFYAGDSPALITGQRGAVRFAALPHSLVGYGVEAGLLTEAQAADRDDSGVVLNVLGFPDMFVHVGPPVRLRPMDTLVVASDALSDNLPVARVCELCRTGPAATALGALARETHDVMTEDPQGHPDDLTMLLYRPTRRRGD